MAAATTICQMKLLNAGHLRSPVTTRIRDGHVRNRTAPQRLRFHVRRPGPHPQSVQRQNKTFFFFNFEQFRQNNLNGTTIIDVPTNAYRQGDFSTALCSSYIGGAAGGGGGVCSPYPTVTAGWPTGKGHEQHSPRAGHDLRPLRPPVSLVASRFDDPFPEQHDSAKPAWTRSRSRFRKFPAPGERAWRLLTTTTFPGYSSFQHTTNLSVKIDHNPSAPIKISGYYSQTEHLSAQRQRLRHEALCVSAALTPTRWNAHHPVNYDQTITPTLLFHVGVGYPSRPPSARCARLPHQALLRAEAASSANNIFAVVGGIDEHLYGRLGPQVGLELQRRRRIAAPPSARLPTKRSRRPNQFDLGPWQPHIQMPAGTILWKAIRSTEPVARATETFLRPRRDETAIPGNIGQSLRRRTRPDSPTPASCWALPDT